MSQWDILTSRTAGGTIVDEDLVLLTTNTFSDRSATSALKATER